MGIQKTSLDNEKIKNILETEYDIKAKKINKIDRGTANIFKIETTKNNYILKEFVSNKKEETIIKEVNIIEFLKERKISVPTYVKTTNGDFYVKNEERIIIVQEFVEGYTIKNNTGNYKQVIECADILGRLTKELMDYPTLSRENIIEENFSRNRVHFGIDKMKKLKTNIKKDNIYKLKIEKDIEYRIKILMEIEENFDFDIINKLTILNSHGDFCSQQLIYNENKETTIIDFEKAKSLPIVWEIMRSYTYIDKNLQNGDIDVATLVEYFKEFQKYINLNEYDLKYAPHIYLLQLASSTYGYKEYNEDFEQNELINFAFFRTKICKSLYNNLEELSSKLIKNKNE